MKTYDSPWVQDTIGSYTKELQQLLAKARLRAYEAGEPVYIQGERSQTFYFLNRGKVKVSIFREDGSEKILAIQEENTFFGESAVFDDQPYFATAMVLAPSEIYHIHRGTLLDVLRRDPAVAFMLMRALIRKVRLLAFQIEDLSFLDAQKRVVHILLTLARDLGVETTEGLDIQKRITHDDLARLTGLSRVTVTNILNYLEGLKLIRKKRCALTIMDLDRLNNLLGSTGVAEEAEQGNEILSIGRRRPTGTSPVKRRSRD